MSDYRITKADAHEARETETLLRVVFVSEGYTDSASASKAFVFERLRNRGELLVAKEAATGEILGVVIPVLPASEARQVAGEDEAEIHLLAVRPYARGRGIASALISACEQISTEHGCRKIVLSTQPSMTAAHRVYERSGYLRNPARDWSKPNGKRYLVYEKKLGGT